MRFEITSTTPWHEVVCSTRDPSGGLFSAIASREQIAMHVTNAERRLARRKIYIEEVNMETTRDFFQGTEAAPILTRNDNDKALANPEHIFSFLSLTQNRAGDQPMSIAPFKFRSACKRAPVGMSVVKIDDGKVLLSNPAMQNLLGYSRQELIGMPFSQFTHPEDVEKQKEAYLKIKSGKRVSFDLKKRYIRKNGTSFTAHLVSTLIRRSDSKPQVMIEMIMEEA